MFDSQPPEPASEVPFRPFTLDEVSRITGAYTGALEAWLKTILGLKLGDDRSTRGLDWMQTFAVFVGKKWLDAGSDRGRAARVVAFVSGLNERGMLAEFGRGNSFPCVTEGEPRMLVRPPKSKLGEELNLRALYREFRHNVRRIFPKG